MCWYVGFSDNINQKETVAKNMLNKISHRGPDSQDFYIDEQIALAFCRLSIIDIDGGNQPMFNEDDSLVLVWIRYVLTEPKS